MNERERPQDGWAPSRTQEQFPVSGQPAELTARRVGEGLWESVFQMSLAGMRGMPRGEASTERQPAGIGVEDALRAMLATLGPGQDLGLALRWNDAPGAGHLFDWRARGSSIHPRRKSAIAGAADLRQSLREMLGVAGFELAHAPETPANLGERLGWRRALAPRGIVVPAPVRHPLGFTAEPGPKGSAVLSLADRSGSRAVASLARSVGRGGRTVALSMRFTPVSLSPMERGVLRTARETLYCGPMNGVDYEDDPHNPLLEPRLLARLLQILELWIREPRGYRVTCTLAADRPLSEAASALIGAAVWGASAGTGDAGSGPAPTTEQAPLVVRLADCIHCSEPPPVVLPSPDAREALGIPRAFPPPSVRVSGDGLILGQCSAPERPLKVRIGAADRRRHCYIIGATGSGKSSLLRQMVVQDMQRGAGLCLIDPHGDLFGEVLRAVPAERAADVVLMDLTDFDHCVGLNFLECGEPHKALQMSFIVNEMLSIFGRLYNLELTGGPMFESYMRNALLTVMDDDTRVATLLDVVRFFEDRRFRSAAIGRCGNAIAASFWNNQALRVSGDHAFDNMAPYITSKLNQFTHNALLRPIIGQTQSTIDFRCAMDEGRIVLVNLAKGLLGELDMRLLGMLLVGTIVNAAMGRVALPRPRRRSFYLYIDEFQTLATPTVVSLLSEARKFGLSLIMANQHLAQLTEGKEAQGVAEAILGNVATMLIFRIGHHDAAELEAYTRPHLDAYDLERLPDRHVVCRMLRDGVPVDPFVMSTLPITASGSARQTVAEAIRERVRAEHTRRRAEVEAEILRAWVRKDRGRDSGPPF